MGHIALSRFRLLCYAITGGLIAVCLISTFLAGDAVADKFHDWKLLPRPERFTELYFTHHANLPLTYGKDKQNVDFTVHNLEHRATAYHYQIVAQAPEKKQVLGEGAVMLEHDRAKNVSKTILVPPIGLSVAIHVKLMFNGIPYGQDSTTAETQDIYYWVNSAQ